MEVDNDLFDLVDINGVHVWDVVRFEIEYSLLWNFTPQPAVNGGGLRKKWNKAKRAVRGLLFLASCTKRQTLSITASRNILDGHHVDYNQHQALKLIPKSELLILESIQNVKAYKGSYPLSAKNVYAKLRKHSAPRYDFEPIIALIESQFTKIRQTNETLNSLLQNFYDDRAFYLRLFKRRKIERVFLTQNGQMKGLLAAAEQTGVKVYEFQHGIVNEKHFVYSYPPQVANVELKSYQPCQILRFSDFWFSNFYAPFEKSTIGNNFFSSPVSPIPTEERSLLVISTNAFGAQLSDIVKSAVDSCSQWKIYYKLHSNEFENIYFYRKKFEGLTLIEIITNEFNINELLSRCAIMLTMQSTVIYEAIQAERNVIIVDSGEYNEIELNGVCHITTPEELADLLIKPFIKPVRVAFFEPFDKKKFLDAIEK